MFIFWSFARVKACVRAISSAYCEDVWAGSVVDLMRQGGIILSGCPWTIVYPAPNGACFWALPSMNQDGTLGSLRGWSVIRSKGLSVISKVWTQSWDRCSASGSGVGSKLAGLRGLQGIKERDGSKRCVWRICNWAGGRERKAQLESKSLKEWGEHTFRGAFRVSFWASGIKRVVAAKAWRQGGHPSVTGSSYLDKWARRPHMPLLFWHRIPEACPYRECTKRKKGLV